MCYNRKSCWILLVNIFVEYQRNKINLFEGLS
nr:MAG TPA: hypothetical protein [Caudoviricetes sp.]